MILKIELEQAIWIKIVDMLATQPYRDVGPIIAEMAQQFAAQQKELTNGQMETDQQTLYPRGTVRTTN